ncbi:MAG: twin-arginine translocation signal domain-containing protein [archaeon]
MKPTSRRNFLKGLAGALGYAAVAPSVSAQEVLNLPGFDGLSILKGYTVPTEYVSTLKQFAIIKAGDYTVREDNGRYLVTNQSYDEQSHGKQLELILKEIDGENGDKRITPVEIMREEFKIMQEVDGTIKKHLIPHN